MGDFDNTCSRIARGLKAKYPYIKLCLIIPYLSKDIAKNREYYYSLYDEIIEPDLGDVFPKAAIVKRNRWMVNKSEYMVAYVKYDYGGAYTTLNYAIKKRKVKVFNIFDIIK